MRYKELSVALSLVMVASSALPLTAEAASNNLDYRKKVIGVAGIMNVSIGMENAVTRAEFAKMLVQASTYRDYLPTSSTVSVYADVPQEHAYAASIRIAAEQNWMTGYLGGQFKPDQAITLKEAARGVLALLGYTDSDFTGNTSNSRMARFYSLELNDELNRNEDEILTRNDCVNLFYNLLKAEMKTSGKAYGTTLGCSVGSDGEINPMGLADNSLKGPKLVLKSSYLGDYVPFNVREASIYLNGDESTYDRLKDAISGNHVVIYYNTTAKTIWAYEVDGDVENGRCAVRGYIDHIYYGSTEVMTPTAVTIDGEEYQLTDSQVQFAFSVYGSLRVGDLVTLICEKTETKDGEATYTVVDYIAD